MNTNGHLMYGGSGASNMVAKIISTNQRCFNLNKMAHPSAHLQRRYGDGSFEIDDSYWRMPPPPQRWDRGVSRATQLMPPPALSPQISDYGVLSLPPSPNQFRPRAELEPPPPPKPQLPKSQFMQLTPQTSIPVQNLQLQQNPTLPMAIVPTNVREDFQPPAPKLSEFGSYDSHFSKTKILYDKFMDTYKILKRQLREGNDVSGLFQKLTNYYERYENRSNVSFNEIKSIRMKYKKSKDKENYKIANQKYEVERKIDDEISRLFVSLRADLDMLERKKK